jgi:hypothetical protein
MSDDQHPLEVPPDTERQADELRGWLGTPWFTRRSLGWGYRPASWQGWGLSVLIVLFVISASGMLRAHHMDLFVASLVALCVAYVAVAAMTSRAL